MADGTLATATTWRNRIVGHTEKSPEQLLANPENYRIHSKLQQQAMSSVLDEIGWVQSVIENVTTGNLIDGHMRVGLALSRGEVLIPVTLVELTIEEERAVLATLDPIGELATRDRDMEKELAQRVAAEAGDILASLVEQLHAKAMVEETRSTPEMRLSPEINERQDYVVILCTNELDWRVLCDRLGVTTSRDADADAEKQTGKAFGLGRVLTAGEVIARLG